MYRLLQLSRNNVKPLSCVYFSHLIFLPNRNPKLYNNRNALKTSVNYQSTFPFPQISGKKTCKRRTKKGYADTMIINHSSASEVRARIRNLRPSDVLLLAQTSLNLNELHKLKDFTNNSDVLREHAYYNLADFHSTTPAEEKVQQLPERPQLKPIVKKVEIQVEDVAEKCSELEEAEELESDLHRTRLRQTVKIAPFQPEVIEDVIEDVEEIVYRDKLKRNAKVAATHRVRESCTRTLASYIEVCATMRSPQKGLNSFTFHRHRYKMKKPAPDRISPIHDVNVYNALLKGFAAKGDFRRVQEVVAIAQEEGVKLGVQSYAAILECIARVNFNDSHTRSIRLLTKEALKQQITYNRILNEAVFLYDQREKVLQAMTTHDIHFKPVYDAPSLQYDNRLLNGLNHPDQLLPDPPKTNLRKPGLFSKEELVRMTLEQVDIERNVAVKVKSIEQRSAASEEVTRCRRVWSEQLQMWESAISEAFNRNLLAQTAQRSAMNYDVYLRTVPVKDIVAIVIDEAQKIAQGSETYSPTTSMLYRELGAKVYARFKVLRKQRSGVLDKILKVHEEYLADYAAMHGQLDAEPDGEAAKVNARQKWQWAEYRLKHEGATIAMDHQEWTASTLVTIGKFLYNIIMHELKVDVNAMRFKSKHKNYLPAFYTIFRPQGRSIKEEVKPHPVLSKLHRASVPETLYFPAYELPMRCPPVPWTSVKNGGYLIAPCDVVRFSSYVTPQRQRLRDAPASQLFPALDSLNQLAAVPWRVNVRILDVIMTVFRKGGSAKLNVPELPASLPPPEDLRADLGKTEKHALLRKRLQHRRKKAEMYSLWCDCLYRVSLANHFRHDVFWLPHNMDFRGRVYPVPPHLNHLGSDLARSMLIFAEARPLGAKGLDWLKLHLVNLTGLKKREPISSRLEFANSLMADILDSADAPLKGRQWWSESEEPWQTLACCMEIAAASRCPNPETFRSHFPVHQDGSCNGLQHYAALGRDEAGAFSVNLCQANVPQDVYSTVATLVEKRRQRDEKDGVEIAKVLNGFVQRKVIKQTVMTTVYGVTRFGARLQIARQLKDIADFPKEFVWAGSAYLTLRTFESLQTMFTSTREIQDWFTECARLISSVCAQNVEWVTPMGLPVVQPYLRMKQTASGDSFHSDANAKPNVMKQKNAFPPNFIHSLDSSHMMLTSLHCEREGISFVSVHDCYWTHPSTVNIMNKICREQFVALHSQPILQNLSSFLTELYSYPAREIKNDGSMADLAKRRLNRALRQLPKTGNFDIEEVMDSVYFFS